jgi:hypothetical protein
VLALLKARLLTVPDLISFALTCLKAAVAARARDGISGKLSRPRVAATATARKNLGRQN